MKKRSLFVSIAAMSLLMAGLIGCGGKPAESESAPAGTSETAKPSSEAPKSSQAPTTSEAPAHVHNYAKVGDTEKNADGKDVFLMECADKDDKYIGIAFKDYSSKSKDFGDQSGYSNVPEDIRNASVLMAKDSSVTWKINIDKAIENAKIAFCMVATSSADEHMTATLPNRYSASVNGADLAPWDFPTGTTYGDVGLNPTKQIYLQVLTANLVAGENTITLYQGNGGYRLLFGGEVRVHFTGDAKPVSPEPEPDAYKVTFVTPAHVKVLVYPGPVGGDPVEANVAYSRDDEGNYAKYVAPVADNPDTADVDETVLEVKPEVNFKLQFEEGYYSDGNLMTISGTMGQEWNKLCCEDLDTYSITKLKGDITVTIAEAAGEEPNSFTANVTAEHCTVVFYQGAKNADGTNIDEGEAGKHNSMNKSGVVTRAKTQFNFEVFPETGYEFAHGLEKGSETSPGGISFVTGRDGHFPGYGNFKVDKKNVNLFSITKVATNLDINIVCTQVAGE